MGNQIRHKWLSNSQRTVCAALLYRLQAQVTKPPLIERFIKHRGRKTRIMKFPPISLPYPTMLQPRHSSTFVLRLAILVSGCFFGLVFFGPVSAQSPQDSDWFETNVRPILAEKCISCHGPTKQWASLRLDSREALDQGSENGAVVIASDLKTSPMLTRILSDDPDVRMPPPDSKLALNDHEKESLQTWILQGAEFPSKPIPGQGAKDLQARAKEHWAFQPLRYKPPKISSNASSTHWIDAYLDESLDKHGLEALARADRRTQLRRLHRVTTGLLPSWEQVQSFEQDTDADAWEKTVDELLCQPQYAEKWARVWMDIARYSDTKGYVYGREDRTFVFSRAYRDWLVGAFQGDLPYNNFIELQLAADHIVPAGSPELAAMGFLTLGRRFLAIQYDIIDDRIDTTFRSLMGLTVQCARCHDHKYDPISAKDYYAFAGVFQSCIDLREEIPAHLQSQTEEFRKGLQERRDKLKEVLAKHRSEANDRIQKRFADYLETQVQLEKYPEGNFNQLSTKDDLIPALVHRWEWYLGLESIAQHPVMRIWTELSKLPEKDPQKSYEAHAAEVLAELQQQPQACHPEVLKEFSVVPKSIREVADRYGKIVQDAATRTGVESPATPSSQDPLLEPLRALLLDRQSAFYIPDEPIDSTEWLWDNGTCVEIWKAQVDIDQWLMNANDSPPELGVLRDRSLVSDARILKRGNANLKGDAVARGYFQFFESEPVTAFQNGSGRLDLARRIASSDNPLTARVWVNRVWQHVFGEGLVQSASDFGIRSDPPSHPELLDALAIAFMEHGWSTRWLIRELATTEAFRRKSYGENAPGRETDPANRMLWRMHRHRLTWEESRDAMAMLSGMMVHRIGGKSVDPLASDENAMSRRTIYTTIDRQYLPMTLQNFDFANPDMHNPKRSETVVPQQALFLLNHPMPAQASVKLVGLIERSEPSELTDEAFVTALYRRVLQREPNPYEQERAVEFLKQSRPLQGTTPQETMPQGLAPRAQLAQVLLIGNEATYID